MLRYDSITSNSLEVDGFVGQLFQGGPDIILPSGSGPCFLPSTREAPTRRSHSSCLGRISVVGCEVRFELVSWPFGAATDFIGAIGTVRRKVISNGLPCSQPLRCRLTPSLRAT